MTEVQGMVRELERRGIHIPEGAAVHLGIFAEPYLKYIYEGSAYLHSLFFNHGNPGNTENRAV